MCLSSHCSHYDYRGCCYHFKQVSPDHTVNQKCIPPPSSASPCLSRARTASFSLTLHCRIKSNLISHLTDTVFLSASASEIPPCTLRPYIKVALTLEKRVRNESDRRDQGTMRHKTHAEGFQALSAPHISTSAPPPRTQRSTHTQDSEQTHTLRHVHVTRWLSWRRDRDKHAR